MAWISTMDRARLHDAYGAVLADLRNYKSFLDRVILTLEWCQKINNSAICCVDLSRAPELKKLVEDGLSDTQRAALTELEALAKPQL